MSNYDDLPSELKRQVAFYLSSKDLAALSCVNKSQAAVAQDQLYYAPEILKPDEGYRLMLLLRTLFARPQLMQKTHSLSIAVVDCSMPFGPESSLKVTEEHRHFWDDSEDSPWCPDYHDIQAKLIHQLSKHGVTELSNPEWIQKIQKWYTAPFYGGLLTILPNLEHLSLSCYVKPVTEPVIAQIRRWGLGSPFSNDIKRVRPPCRIAEGRNDGFPNNLFGLSKDEDLDSTVSQHFKLKMLDLVSGYLSRPFWQFYGLQCIKLSSQSAIACGPFPTRLEICLTHGFNDWSLAELGLYLRSGSLLKHIKIRFEPLPDEKGGIHPNVRFWHFSNLLKTMEASASTLETLALVPTDYAKMDIFRYIDQDLCFWRFTQLRKLTLPSQWSSQSKVGKLPPNIEELKLLFTHPMASQLADDIVNHKLEFGKLCRLDLVFQGESDVAVEESFWAKFKDNRISVYVWVREHSLFAARPA
ncbi:uncharacterized protein K460DRAFT_365078 [Cucurbitaria berberidis CBS 394.84]|uniref:F-box domain-containing protein n=1 Tax=Cucurbitaria berberidis CBS 394.84 TaxID=1168544 RepID=A0A9P4GNZ7_9PLEO|nr:uncharacterized protein K460DRAFT_365078 [Cucurbitaria berberidis CBS 394.84]KAF1849167.1 hypothetical protein K460DRAFT_365078 [Cucurbitaria berberidis CBS 394.84]